MWCEWLKILSRITKPTKGRAMIDARVVSLLEANPGQRVLVSGNGENSCGEVGANLPY
jgi:ABC-type polysaccharide/polyol phosphate transport system ATPase subunit